MDDRLRLRRTFDAEAERYNRARPRYPEALFDALVARTGVRPGDRVLEVGPGTGVATEGLAARGLHVTGVELGEQLARCARAKFAGQPLVEVVHADFESWAPRGRFDLVVSATAWHWIDPAIRYERAWTALRPGGHLALWTATHVFPDGGDPLFDEIQPVYDAIGEGIPAGPRPRPGELAADLAEIERSGRFTDAGAEEFDWDVTYSLDAYLDLLDTFSSHIAMSPEDRGTLHAAIGACVARRAVPELVRGWGAVLRIARRVE